MKILFLAIPFSGVDSFVGALSKDTFCRFESDPMRQYGSMKRSDVLEKRAEGMYVHPRDNHNYNDVPDNTYMTHMVGAHPLPYNLTEQQFMLQLKGKFDKTICMLPDNVEINWKRKCAIDHFTPSGPWDNNLEFKNHKTKVNGEFIHRYEDSMRSQSVVDSITNSYNELHTFAHGTSGIKIVNPQDFIGDVIENRIDIINTELGTWGMDNWQGIQLDHENMQVHKHWVTLNAVSSIEEIY